MFHEMTINIGSIDHKQQFFREGKIAIHSKERLLTFNFHILYRVTTNIDSIDYKQNMVT